MGCGRCLVFGTLAMSLACSLDESGAAGDAAGASDNVATDVTEDVADTSTDVPMPDVVEEPPPPPCNPSGAFGSFTNLGIGVDTNDYEAGPSLTSDELTMYFGRSTVGNHIALFYVTRPLTTLAFNGAAMVTSISSGQGYDSAPSIVDGLTTIYFASTRNGAAHYHLYQAFGTGSVDGFSNITALTTQNSVEPISDIHPFFSTTTSELWFSSDRAGTLDIYVAANPAAVPIPAAALNSAFADFHPTLSHDGLTMFFGRTDTVGRTHVWVATRASTPAAFGNPVQVLDFESGNGDDNTPGWLSVDGCRMYFTSTRASGQGSADLWMATRGT